jgi:tripeptide aminopeptidase
MINKNRLTKRFLQLAETRSPTGEEDAVRNIVVNTLSSLGFKVRRDPAGNVIASLEGSGEPIMLCGHLDTVAVPAGRSINAIVGDQEIRSDGTTILGADNKDNVAAILEAVSVVSQAKERHLPIEVVFTTGEEAISKGAKQLSLDQLTAKRCVISDCASPYGEIVMSAPGCTRYDCFITGKSAHVKSPEQGVNALKAAALAMASAPTGQVTNHVTANIAYALLGLAAGLKDPILTPESLREQNRNSVPDQAHIFGEVRGTDKDELEDTLKKTETCFMQACQGLGATCSFGSEVLAAAYHHERNDPLVELVATALSAQGAEPRYIETIGGSDANVLNGLGIKTVLISSAHRNNHQPDEYLIIEDLVKLADFYVRPVTS